MAGQVYAGQICGIPCYISACPSNSKFHKLGKVKVTP